MGAWDSPPITGSFDRDQGKLRAGPLKLLSRLSGMGTSGSKLDKALKDVPESVKWFGLENFCATCYCNSVLQSLYFCDEFRTKLLEYADASSSGDNKEPGNLLIALGDLFTAIHTQKKKTGMIGPRKFVNRLKQDNELFKSSFMHQDAHEFLNFLLNESCEILEKEEKAKRPKDENGEQRQHTEATKTWIHDIFQGITVNETRCLCCETVTTRDETFLDLSLEISPNSSITSCLRNFSSKETLANEDKFYCDNCGSQMEAQRRMRIKKLPNTLVLHLKRFKFVENIGRMKKLSYRVVFPMELKLCNTVDDNDVADQEYMLCSVVVHLGSRPDHGHYVALVKSHEHWLLFDDDVVTPVDESEVQNYFGMAHECHNNTEHGYMLFYSRVKPQNTGITRYV